MGDPAAYRRQIRALLTHDRDTARQLNRMLSPADRPEFNEYLDAVFTVLVNWRFRHGCTADDAATFADHVTSHYRRRGVGANEYVIEEVVLGAVGGPLLLGEIPPDRKANAQVMVIGTMTDDDPQVAARVDDFLDRSEVVFDNGRDNH